ncbi:NAD-dependent epimerase/dehydratase family protein [Arthrobacter sp. CAU 1506]|uniref:sugar nucleotide-binding protein n=1 Tax=Arthrobacter sp. CAU 1506 TaxID=2560052 RepID=UPI0010AC2130|nr:bifunctional dTDP-4-dehydrorhamnose 3,5-epimerase family protein/NAD(P)-dependent oxidoreductase [Arthrobacter sp. CAU 1506]TJY72343.1 NAD-dependent epimerase/dehydratase family protein [Arthrobacter sp. CAU 1506]
MSAPQHGIEQTSIPGLLVVSLPVHGDNRGWFKENWQREKLVSLGLPDFGPVQNNISFNARVGTTRGIHAEPWDKYVSVAAGRIFGAWVDLRDGPSFGERFCLELGPDRAVFVPRGVGNGFQTLEPDTVYSYLVNDHWNARAQEDYVYLNAGDEAAAIPWPIPLAEAELSEKDLHHPPLRSVVPMKPQRILVLGADGQLGRALRQALPDAEFASRTDFDLTREESYRSRDWSAYRTIINAAAYTDVDGAESSEGRRLAWQLNATAVSRLATIAAKHRLTLVHLSSDYVFDGSQEPHPEAEPPSPLGVYGQSKAAGDAAAATAPRHYIVRTSWVVGDGKNFVRTMAGLAARDASPSVVADQYGRLTFTRDLAAGIRHLLHSGAPFGTYNLTNSGPVTSWAEVAAEIYRLLGKDPQQVIPVITADYRASRPAAPRPERSTLELAKIEATGFRPPEAFAALRDYLATDPVCGPLAAGSPPLTVSGGPTQ